MLDTYGMDDINTQAIRELTTEVEGVKQKLNKTMKTVKQIETELLDKVEIETVTVEVTGTVQPGAVAVFTPTLSKLPKSAIFRYCASGDTSNELACLTFYPGMSGQTPAIRIRIYNPTDSALSFNNIVFDFIY